MIAILGLQLHFHFLAQKTQGLKERMPKTPPTSPALKCGYWLDGADVEYSSKYLIVTSEALLMIPYEFWMIDRNIKCISVYLAN